MPRKKERTTFDELADIARKLSNHPDPYIKSAADKLRTINKSLMQMESKLERVIDRLEELEQCQNQ